MREFQREGVRRQGSICVVLLIALGVATVWRAPALGLIKYGPLQISGNLETQDIVRDPSVDQFQFIQNRNTFRLRVDWDWLQNSKFIDKFDVPFIERSKLFVLYRGVYDGFYGIGPNDRQRGQTRFDDLVGGRITDLSNTSGAAYENRLREAYVDFNLKGAPLSFRLGRQQVIWGESDQFRIMDIWNPLDITWHFQQESWDNIRIPLWLGKGLWDIGQLGPLSNTFLEVVYNPFDFQPGIKAGFLPQPWALPFPNPLRQGQLSNPGGTDPTPGHALVSPVFDLQGTSLRRGDFQRNPADASEIGTRFHGVTPQGLEFSLDYLYGRGRGVGAASPFALRIEKVDLPTFPNGTCTGGMATKGAIGCYQRDINNPATQSAVFPIDVTAEVIHPYMHIFGLTGNYFEGDFTQAVLRFESAYAMGEPFQTTEADTLVPVTVQGHNLHSGFSPLGFTKRDVWTGMLGFDRPTWIRWLNSKATWFLSGQFFWNYTTGRHIDNLVGSAGAGEAPYYGPIGQWVSGPFKGQVEREQNGDTKTSSSPGVGNGDGIRRWEHLITMAATSFYRGGTVVPFIADAWDPVNDNNETLWNVDYYYTNDFIITLGQKFFYTYGSNFVSDDPWYAGGRFARRDETWMKLTYQF